VRHVAFKKGGGGKLRTTFWSKNLYKGANLGRSGVYTGRTFICHHSTMYQRVVNSQTRRAIPKDSNMHQHHCGNPTSDNTRPHCSRQQAASISNIFVLNLFCCYDIYMCTHVSDFWPAVHHQITLSKFLCVTHSCITYRFSILDCNFPSTLICAEHSTVPTISNNST
jgi:hypothetical protein